MATKKKSGGGKKTGGDTPTPFEDVIEFTPEGGFNIRTAARNFANIMESSNQPLIIHLKHVSVEFEPGCTPKEIIDGYNMAMQAKATKPSNSNAGAKK